MYPDTKKGGDASTSPNGKSVVSRQAGSPIERLALALNSMIPRDRDSLAAARLFLRPDPAGRACRRGLSRTSAVLLSTGRRATVPA